MSHAHILTEWLNPFSLPTNAGKSFMGFVNLLSIFVLTPAHSHAYPRSLLGLFTLTPLRANARIYKGEWRKPRMLTQSIVEDVYTWICIQVYGNVLFPLHELFQEFWFYCWWILMNYCMNLWRGGSRTKYEFSEFLRTLKNKLCVHKNSSCFPPVHGVFMNVLT